MKKWQKTALVCITLLVIFSLTTGCFGGLDDAQETAATYVNAIYAKADTPSAEERYQKIVSAISPNSKAKPSEHKDEIIKVIMESAAKGLTQPYYIANNPSEPQSDTRRSVVIRIPLGSFAMDSSNMNEDSYVGFILAKEGNNWKILNFKDVDKEKLSHGDIEWQEINPTDYLD